MSLATRERNLKNADDVYAALESHREELMDCVMAGLHQAEVGRHTFVSDVVSEWVKHHQQGQVQVVRSMIAEATTALTGVIAEFQRKDSQHLDVLGRSVESLHCSFVSTISPFIANRC